jgi:transcriptional regulator with XRE-family HTH domain
MTKRPPRLDDTAWLRKRRAEGWSVTKLAAELGIDHRQVSAALRRAGLPVPFPARRRYPQLHDVVWLSDALTEHCTEDVARILGCAPQSVRYAARKYGVAAMINGHDLSPEITAKLADREWLAARRTDGVTARQLASELGISPGRVSAAIHDAGLPPVRRNGSKPAFPQLYDPAWIRSQLATKTKAQVARDLGCCVRSVRDAAARAGVPTRPQSLSAAGGSALPR